MQTTAPHPDTLVRRIHIPPAPFPTERTVLVQQAHAWRATIRRPAPRWRLPAALALLALCLTAAATTAILHHPTTPGPVTVAAKAVRP